LRAPRPQGTPDAAAGGLVGWDVDLEAVFAGVAGASDEDVVERGPLLQGELAPGEPVVFDRGEVGVGELLQRGFGAGTLDGELGVEVGVVVDVDAGHGPDLFADPRDVLVASACVDDEEVVVVAELVDDHIVHERPVRVEHCRVVGLADGELRCVVHAQALHGGERAGAAELDVAHVRDVEEADAGADGHVFGDEAGVFDGHVPAPEVDHLGAVRAMGCVERGLAQRCHRLRHGNSL
jgi:hypothetical protein